MAKVTHQKSKKRSKPAKGIKPHDTPDETRLTPEQLGQVESMAGLGLSKPKMASILGISAGTFDRLYRHDAAVRDAAAKGEAVASNNVLGSLYEKCTVDKDTAAIKFWCMTREGMSTKNRLEVTGPEGGPIQMAELTPSEKKKSLKKILKILELTDDDE